jgi:hypothetical protein
LARPHYNYTSNSDEPDPRNHSNNSRFYFYFFLNMTSRKKPITRTPTHNRGLSYNLSNYQNTLNNNSSANSTHNDNSNNLSSNKRKSSAIDLEVHDIDYDYYCDEEDSTNKDKSEGFTRLEGLVLGNNLHFTYLSYLFDN